MRTHRPDDMDATGPIQLPGAHLRDAGRRRITGATSWSAIGGAALAVTFGALFAQATANAEAEKAPSEPVTVANTEEATETTAPAAAPKAAASKAAASKAPASKAAASKAAAPRTSAPKPAAPKIAVNPTDEPDAPAPPAAAPKATTSTAPADASSGAT